MWLLVQLVTCAFMTGLIWLIQAVHYPSFKSVSAEGFTAFHRFHRRRIGWMVMPVMTLEMVSAAALVLTGRDKVVFAANLFFLVLIWLNTAFLSVSQHRVLARSRDPEALRKLVSMNWPRTLLWSLRLLILVFYMYPLVEASYNH